MSRFIPHTLRWHKTQTKIENWTCYLRGQYRVKDVSANRCIKEINCESVNEHSQRKILIARVLIDTIIRNFKTNINHAKAYPDNFMRHGV